MSSKPRTARITRKQPKSAARAEARRNSVRGRSRGKNAAKATGVATAPGTRPVYANLSAAPDALVQRAMLGKLGFIQRFLAEGCPRGRMMEYARLHAEASGLKADAIPPYTTLHTWVQRVRTYGAPGLVDQPRRDAGVSRTVRGEALTAVECGLANGHGPSRILHTLSRVLDGDLPKYDAVRRELRRMEREEPLLAALAKRGPTAFRDLIELTTTFPVVPGGMRLSIDSTVLDRWVRVPDGNGGWRPIRPVLTVVEDIGSRLLVTFNLSLFPIDSGICAAVLGRALNSRQNYPELLSVGVPYEITLDKGAEHQGQFLAMLRTLQIEVVPRNDNSPRGGAHVERLIGTITTEVCPNQLGYSKTERIIDPYAPSDRDTKRNLAQLKFEPFKLDIPVSSLATLSELEVELLAWATIYNARPHVSLEVENSRIQEIAATACIAQRPRLDRGA